MHKGLQRPELQGKRQLSREAGGRVLTRDQDDLGVVVLGGNSANTIWWKGEKDLEEAGRASEWGKGPVTPDLRVRAGQLDRLRCS